MNLGADAALGVVVDTGDGVLPLRRARAAGLLDGADEAILAALDAPDLGPLLAAGRDAWSSFHDTVRRVAPRARDLLLDESALDLRLPFPVADYVDFYASIHHATNLGRLLRPGTEPLFPNWRHLPVSYHGRAGTVVVSGTPVRRPKGLVPAAGANTPTLMATSRLDIELEIGVVVGGRTEIGEPMPIHRAAEHVFGVVLLNDWSARDIQAYEYQPLGPHLGKSFATSISAWVTPIDDLRPFFVPGPVQSPAPSAHLRSAAPWGIDLDLRVLLQTRAMRAAGEAPFCISTTNFATTYWTIDQQLAHLTANGAALRPGDLFGSGTVSGPARGSEGSLIELSWGGEEPIAFPDGTHRTFLDDGDRVVLEGRAGAGGAVVRLGPVEGEILPAA